MLQPGAGTAPSPPPAESKAPQTIETPSQAEHGPGERFAFRSPALKRSQRGMSAQGGGGGGLAAAGSARGWDRGQRLPMRLDDMAIW